MKTLKKEKTTRAKVDILDTGEENEEVSEEWVKQTMNQKPMYASPQEAIADYTRQMNELVAKIGKPINKIFHEWEYEGVVNDDYERALDLHRLIWATKKICHV